MKTSIITTTYNEELRTQFFIDFYKKNIPDCQIIFYDNMSTDNTQNIIKNNNCELIIFDTNNRFSDLKNQEIKNNAWKNIDSDWIITCDSDELLNVKEYDLEQEFQNGTTILSTQGFNMINMVDDCNLQAMNYGCREPNYDKKYCFNKNLIKEMNYTVGCHACAPTGEIKYSEKIYNAYHFNFVNIDIALNKYKLYASRLSDENIKNSWGFHYNMKEIEIRKEFNDLRQKAVKLF